MIKHFTLFCFITLSLFTKAQTTSFNNHEVAVDFGSFRNSYLYPITNIRYTSPIVTKYNLQFSARLRSYGTLFFFSKSAYDISPIAEWYFHKKNPALFFSIGVGMDARIRLVNDTRSDATSSAEPIGYFSAKGAFNKVAYSIPFWTRFYSNGISQSIQPQIAYQVAKQLSVFARYELSFLKIYRISPGEWRQDCFIGTSIYF